MNARHQRHALPVLLALAFAAGGATAQSTMAASGAKPSMTAASGASNHAAGKLSAFDSAFLEQAAQNGHAELNGAKAALEKATDSRVKSYAQQLIDDHTKMHEELAALASSKGVELPKDPSLGQKAKAKVLSMRDGDSFDKHFIESMGIKAHESTIKLFKRAATEATDPDVKALATKSLPTLEAHLKQAHDLHASLNKKK
jgi:putative membrane protein